MRPIATLLVFAVLAAHATVSAADREWQTGTWYEARVERPRVLFSAQTRDPNSPLPRTSSAAREIRIYVIETETARLELRQETTVDTPKINVLIGRPVTFAVEKKTVYIKDEEGREYKLELRKQSALSAPQPK
jgi:hypothetical protein